MFQLSLIVGGFGIFPKIYKCVGFNKQLVWNFFKQVFCLYISTLESGLCYENCKLFNIQVYISFSNNLTQATIN